MSDPPTPAEAQVSPFRVASPGQADEKRTEPARALVERSCCGACRRPLSGRQRTACSPRCRAALSRQRRDEVTTDRSDRLEGDHAGPWRFRVSPPGRRFGWRGHVYASDRQTGILEVREADFAAALRQLAIRDRIEELR